MKNIVMKAIFAAALTFASGMAFAGSCETNCQKIFNACIADGNPFSQCIQAKMNCYLRCES